MAGWQANRGLRIGVAAIAGAIAVSLVAPTAAEAASTHRGSSQGNTAKSKRDDAQAKHKATGSGAAGQGPSGAPGSGHASATKQAQRKDAPPDRGPHKYSPKKSSQSGDSSSGRDSGSAPKSRVGVQRPDSRGPNKVTPQQRTPTAAADRDNDRHDSSAAGRVSPRKPNTNANVGSHDQAYRTGIDNGRPVNPAATPLDAPDDDDVLPVVPGMGDVPGPGEQPPVLRVPAIVPPPGPPVIGGGGAPRSAGGPPADPIEGLIHGAIEVWHAIVGDDADEADRNGRWEASNGPKPNPHDITTEGRRAHILYGDWFGGGHKHDSGSPGKNTFPKDWDDDKIIAEIEDVAKNPDSPPAYDEGRGVWKVRGTRDGVDIEVIVEPDGQVKTGYPTGGESVHRNDENGDPQPLK